ncbi:pentapeptide repeat-containing protein [Amycolatopsis sp. WAC 04182]|uniref:pentapeptide repeat-containing protein n=1 Tax=Amycolatopsis sp. WAC 04182 TaxID=2203198 RepID=UPI000F774ACA|nr:pentapeptide repeat-containing protein [Amycolatopsis sp. WAC 04182]
MIVVPVTVLAGVAITLLLVFVDSSDPKNQIELIKTGLTLGAGTGGVLALVLARRRQWFTEHDAAERRLTELYLKAVEQLGSDRAAIRHGGLYALERVAQGNPSQRQTVVNVLCAYLRAPFRLPDEPHPRSRAGIRRPLAASRPGARHLAAGGRHQTSGVAAFDDETRQEQEVRLTAQRILSDHIRPGPDRDHPRETYWADIDLDLTGAVLLDLDLDHCHLRSGRFIGATIARNTLVRHARFDGNADFGRVKFSGVAQFESTHFAGHVWFTATSFAQEADFSDVEFNMVAWFRSAIFAGETLFRRSKFAGKTSFESVAFKGEASFEATNFTQPPQLEGADFHNGLPQELPHR